MLRCQELVELVTDYLEGVLDQDTADAFRHHVMDCDGCLQYLAQVQHTTRLVADVPSAAGLAPDERDKLLAVYRAWSADRDC